jgi:hypothetical protein
MLMLLSPKKGTMGQLTKLLAQAAITTLATKTVEMSAEFLGRWQRWQPRLLNKKIFWWGFGTFLSH